MPPGFKLWSAFGGLPDPHLRLTYHLHSVSCLHAHPGCFSAQQSIPSYPTVTWNSALPKVSSLSLHPTLASFPTVCSPSTNMFCFWINHSGHPPGSPLTQDWEEFNTCNFIYNYIWSHKFNNSFSVCFLNSKNGGRDSDCMTRSKSQKHNIYKSILKSRKCPARIRC